MTRGHDGIGREDIGPESKSIEEPSPRHLLEILGGDNPEASGKSSVGSSRSALDKFLERNKSIENREAALWIPGDNPNERVAVITCMDCRNTDILGSTDLKGAKLIRSAGATPSGRDLDREHATPMSSFHRMLEGLTDSNVERVIVIPHEGCGMNRTEADFPAALQIMKDNKLELGKLAKRERLWSTDEQVPGKILEWFGFFPDVNENGSALAKHIQQVTRIPTATLTLDIHNGTLNEVRVPDEMREFIDGVLTQHKHIASSDQFKGLDHKPRLNVVVLSDQDGALFEKAAGIQRGDAIHVQTNRLDSLIYSAQPERWNIGPEWYRDEIRSLAAATNFLGATEIVVAVGNDSQFYKFPQRAIGLAEFIRAHPAIPPGVSIHVVGLDSRTGKIREWSKSA